MKIKAAPLDLILQANNLPTGDELRQQKAAEIAARTEAEKAKAPNFLNHNQRRSLRKVIEKANRAEQPDT